MTELAILIPVLRRPHRVEPVLESARATVPDALILFIPNPDDDAEVQALIAADAQWLAHDGNYAAKINVGVLVTDTPFLLLGADDLKFHPGWYEKAKAKMTKRIGVVATNDLCNARCMAGQLATHPLVTRAYAERGTIDEPNKVLHEGYSHEYADDELTGTAIKRRAFAFAPDAIVEHLHPDAGKAPMDDLYAARKQRMRRGQRVFFKRRHLWA